jgi:hypothetical protein
MTWLNQIIASLGTLEPNIFTFGVGFLIVCAVAKLFEGFMRLIMLGFAAIAIVAVVYFFASAHGALNPMR